MEGVSKRLKDKLTTGNTNYCRVRRSQQDLCVVWILDGDEGNLSMFKCCGMQVVERKEVEDTSEGLSDAAKSQRAWEGMRTRIKNERLKGRINITSFQIRSERLSL